jgi:PAS domain S-box-containing protein
MPDAVRENSATTATGSAQRFQQAPQRSELNASGEPAWEQPNSWSASWDQCLKHLLGFSARFVPHVNELLRSLAVPRHSIGARLLAGVLLFSGSVTLVLTVIQLYIDYQRDVSALEVRLNQISGSYLASLAEGLWTLDERQLRLQLDGILRLPDIRAVEVREAADTGNQLIAKLGENSVSSSFAREYPLRHNVQGQERVIGILRVEATLADAHRRLVDTAVTILISQAAKTFLVSFFILYLFHYLVTRHLSAIVRYLDNYRITDTPFELRLPRRPPRYEDELQRVVTAFNTLSHTLQTVYRALSERETKIRRLVDANIVGIIIWNIDGQIIEANDAFLRMVGYDREDLASGRVNRTDLTPREWHERDARTLAELKASGIVQPFEKEYFRKDGSRIPVLIGVTAFDEDQNQGVGFVLDLTERKRAEVELRESEQNYRTLFESIDEGFCTIEVMFDHNEKPLDYRFLQISPSFERQTGIKNAVGRRMREIAPQHEEHWFEIYGRIALTGEAMRFENEAKQLKRWYDVYAFRVEDPKCRRVGILFNDITERKQTEERLRASEQRFLDAQMELARVTRVTTMGELTASIAHEVNQPLAAVRANAEACLRWLDRPTPDLDAARQSVGWVISDSNRASEVIRRVRTLTKKSDIEMVPLDVNDVVMETIALVQRELISHQVSLRTELASPLPMVLGDRVQLQQVIINLVMNGIQAMQSVTDRSRELVIRSGRDETRQVIVSVTDCGTGISGENASRLFNPFFTTKSSGMGMGLSISRSIMEGHGGRLWATANVPHGATFQFILPVNADTAK